MDVHCFNYPPFLDGLRKFGLTKKMKFQIFFVCKIPLCFARARTRPSARATIGHLVYKIFLELIVYVISIYFDYKIEYFYREKPVRLSFVLLLKHQASFVQCSGFIVCCAGVKSKCYLDLFRLKLRILIVKHRCTLMMLFKHLRPTSTNYQGDQLSRGNNMKISQLHFNVLHFKCNFVQHLNFCVQDTFARATQSA